MPEKICFDFKCIDVLTHHIGSINGSIRKKMFNDDDDDDDDNSIQFIFIYVQT
jgi:hypothetical protein